MPHRPFPNYPSRNGTSDLTSQNDEERIKRLEYLVTELKADMKVVHQTFRTNKLYAVLPESSKEEK
jgi:hypothetical protein